MLEIKMMRVQRKMILATIQIIVKTVTVEAFLVKKDRLSMIMKFSFSAFTTTLSCKIL